MHNTRTQNPNFLVKPNPNPTRSQKALLVKACLSPSTFTTISNITIFVTIAIITAIAITISAIITITTIHHHAPLRGCLRDPDFVLILNAPGVDPEEMEDE